MSAPLFSNATLNDFLESKISQIRSEIDTLSRDYVSGVDTEEFANFIHTKYSLVPPTIYPDKKELLPLQEGSKQVSDFGQEITVNTLELTLVVPFTGEPELLSFTPDRIIYYSVVAEVTEGEINISYRLSESEKNKLKSLVNADITNIETNLESVKRRVDSYNNEIKSLVINRLNLRKEQITQDENFIKSTGIPIRRIPTEKLSFKVPVEKRRIIFKKPQVSEKDMTVNWHLEEKEFTYILSVIKSLTDVMERSPKTFVKLGEEEIRDHFLMHLNGHYENKASGETFNYSGKTDIFLRHQDKNVFIAECKIWDGQKKALEAIDQLLSYTSWRDTKTALLLFNRRDSLTRIINSFKKVLPKHTCFLSEDKQIGETHFQYKFHHLNDEEREITVAVLFFDVPSLDVK